MDKHLSNNEVPVKFTNWLLSMGCPREKIPSPDKLAQMCRGQYSMIWRSLMERVEPKDVIRLKRLQVFHDDIQRCYKANSNVNAPTPVELSLWLQQQEIKRKVTEGETRIKKLSKQLAEAMDTVTTKQSQHNRVRRDVQNAQRRAAFMQNLSEELRDRRNHLLEARSIAEALCRDVKSGKCSDVQTRLDHYISLLIRQHAPSHTTSNATPAVSSSALSTDSNGEDSEYHLSALSECNAEEVWKELSHRRANLVSQLATSNVGDTMDDKQVEIVTPRCVLSQTTVMHCLFGMEALKQRAQVKQRKSVLFNAMLSLNDLPTDEARELLVIFCEKAKREARVETLKHLLEELLARRGVFKPREDEPLGDQHITCNHIILIDKTIVSKKDEIKKQLASLWIVEGEMVTEQESLQTIFKGFQNECETSPSRELDASLSSITSLRDFYQRRRERRPDLSLVLDASDGSVNGRLGHGCEPTIINELRFYNKEVNLERNRKLVLESGEKIWVYETMQSSIERFQWECLSDGLTCSLVCPSGSLPANLKHLMLNLELKKELNLLVRQMTTSSQRKSIQFDVEASKEKEDSKIDIIKKPLNENIMNLHKTSKTLDTGCSNLQLWSQDHLKKYISCNRTVDGKTYRDYETAYLKYLSPVL